ncbi:hypothetical protein, partial [Nocardioides mangrovi]
MSKQQQAGGTLFGLALGAVVVAIVSSLVAAAQWPDEAAGTGNELIAYLAYGVAVLAFLALLVVVVACGVRLGIDWSGLADRPSTTADSPTATGVVGAP